MIPKDPSSGFSKLCQIVVIVVCGDIPKSVALMLGANRLLAMAKDIGGFHPIAIGEVFLWLISHSIILQLWGLFQEHLSPISLEYQSLEVVRPSFLASEPSSTYTLIGPWCKSMLKTFLIMFFELLFLESCVMSRGLWWTLSFLPSCFMVLILFFTTSMDGMWRGSPLLSHF